MRRIRTLGVGRWLLALVPRNAASDGLRPGGGCRIVCMTLFRLRFGGVRDYASCCWDWLGPFLHGSACGGQIRKKKKP